jgi:hypothetical protein
MRRIAVIAVMMGMIALAGTSYSRASNCSATNPPPAATCVDVWAFEGCDGAGYEIYSCEKPDPENGPHLNIRRPVF